MTLEASSGERRPRRASCGLDTTRSVDGQRVELSNNQIYRIICLFTAGLTATVVVVVGRVVGLLCCEPGPADSGRMYCIVPLLKAVSLLGRLCLPKDLRLYLLSTTNDQQSPPDLGLIPAWVTSPSTLRDPLSDPSQPRNHP